MKNPGFSQRRKGAKLAKKECIAKLLLRFLPEPSGPHLVTSDVGLQTPRYFDSIIEFARSPFLKLDDPGTEHPGE
jgi:hypothetical protein